MPQSLVQIYLHLVFSTKHREPFLRDPLIREEMHGYLKGILDNLGCPRLKIGGVEDHVHILCQISQNVSLVDLIRDLKRDSTKWIKSQYPTQQHFHWQAGYGAFSVSPAHIDVLCEYIAKQEDHHRQVSFQEEFRKLCLKYGIALDERYVWD
jgi:REP element-mobilizing transposase RayT